MNMHTVLLICEAFIGLFGIFAVIMADNAHERLHGAFVVLLAVDGFLGYLLPNSIISNVLLIILALMAIVMIGMSIQHIACHIKKVKSRKKALQEGIAGKYDETDDKKFDLFDFDKKFDLISETMLKRENELAEVEKKLLERENQIYEMERRLFEREKELATFETSSETALTDDSIKG